MLKDMRSAQTEVELLVDLLKNHYEETLFTGYEMDQLNCVNYIEDKDTLTEERYRKEVIGDSMEAFADLLNRADIMEFQKPPLQESKPGEPVTFIQVLARDNGLWLRKTTVYCAFGILGDQCPEHTDCPEECTFIPENKGLGPGTRTVYDVHVRTNPRLKVE